MARLGKVFVVVLAALVVGALGVVPALAADVTTPFAGKTVNGGTVTHEHRAGRHTLTVSADFQVPGSPDPHWQVVVCLKGRRQDHDDVNTDVRNGRHDPLRHLPRGRPAACDRRGHRLFR